ncbi:Feruloyl esterase [Neonectria punicea]|uniref:Feruloyl esterase n=1 Tax=Neonectria punicea TaxID=979145 RepID=A0ABR1H0D2_9HYPO
MAQASKTSSLLTVIITTSVTPSAPSTDLLTSVLESFQRYCPSLMNCRVIVVFDGYDQVVSAARLKKGYVTPEQARDFSLYKENVKKLILEHHYGDNRFAVFTQQAATAEYGSPCKHENIVHYTTSQTQDGKVTFIEPARRLGFGLAVRSALRISDTPYVWVQQHDWALVSDFSIDPLLQVMKASEMDPEIPIKYVCLPAVRMLSYATSPDVVKFPVLKQATAALKGDFSPASDPSIKVPLTPLFFWHDKPHVASTAHYLARVFPTRLAMLRGDFIEDKIGQRARAQMKQGSRISIEASLPWITADSY